MYQRTQSTRVKRQPTEWEKVFGNPISDKNFNKQTTPTTQQ
jgi:hypothetical protein